MAGIVDEYQYLDRALVHFKERGFISVDGSYHITIRDCQAPERRCIQVLVAEHYLEREGGRFRKRRTDCGRHWSPTVLRRGPGGC